MNDKNIWSLFRFFTRTSLSVLFRPLSTVVRRRKEEFGKDILVEMGWAWWVQHVSTDVGDAHRSEGSVA